MGRVPRKALQGKHSAAVLAKYKAYLENPDIAKQDNPVTNRPKSKKLYLHPFDLGLPAKTYAIVSASVPVVTKYLLKVNTGGSRVKADIDTTGATPDVPLKLEGYRAARVVIRTGRSDTGTRKLSKTSGMPYKYYGGRSVSIPFGRKDDSETMLEAFEIIQEQIAPEGGQDNPLVTLLKEEVRGY